MSKKKWKPKGHHKQNKNFRKKLSSSHSSKSAHNQIRFDLQKHQVVVNAYSEEWLLKDFDQVYHKEIIASGATLKNGTWVEILSRKQSFLGWGIACQKSKTHPTNKDQEDGIAIFRLSKRNESEKARLKELRTYFHHCIQQRKVLENTSTIYRLIHGGNDNFPGIRVDRFGSEICCTYATEGLSELHDEISTWLWEYNFPHRIWKYIRDSTGNHVVMGEPRIRTPQKNIMTPASHFTQSVHPQASIGTELDIQYIVMPHRSPDAGVFCDMRDLRTWLKPCFHQKTFLNLFCFTGAFSVQALANGARHVTSVDLSQTYLDWLQANIALNFPQDDLCDFDVIDPSREIHPFVRERHTAIASDAIKALDNFRRKSQKFDIVLADPPSFSHSSEGVWSVEGDLQKLVNACLRVVAEKGLLIVASNHGKLSPKEFSKAIIQATRKVQRRCKIIHTHTPGIDVPAGLHVPTGRYLKCWVLQCD